MTERIAFLCLWFVIAFTEVACWTVDLDEVRQFLDKQKEQEDYEQLHYHNYYDESDEYEGFAEVTQAQAHRGHNYAHQYGYQGYMEKKVHGYVYKGAQYLDGLRQALENYKQLIENCSVYNLTEFDNLNASLLPDVRWNETADVWNWNWAQGERRVQWPQILNITNTGTNVQSTTQGATLTPMQGATLRPTQGAPLGAPPGANLGAPTGTLIGAPPGALGASLGTQPGASVPPGVVLGAPPRANLGASPGTLRGAPSGALGPLPRTSLGTLPGDSLGAPPGASFGNSQGTSQGASPGVPLSPPLGVPSGAPSGSSLGGPMSAMLEAPPGGFLAAPPGAPLGASPGAPPVATPRATQFNLSEAIWREQAQRAKCQKATREREHVRRLADLALFTARQLQNWANHEKLDDKSYWHAKEERALITRLAYFLDKLAELTGYTPEIKVFSKQTDRTTTTTSNPMSVAMSEELRQQLLNCLRQRASSSASSAPATERCRAPLMLPPSIIRMFNITEDNTSVSSTTATPAPRSSALTTTPPPLRIDPEQRQARVLDNYLLSTLWAQQPVRTKRKRSVNEPLMKMVEYFTKHKAWTGVNNQDIEKLMQEELKVNNHLAKPKSLEDRSDFFKRKLVFGFLYPFKNRGFRRPKISNLIKGDKLNKYLEKLRKSDVFSDVKKVNIPRKLKSIQKRSIVIEQSEDPKKDISYYVKNKPGTNVRPSLADAVRVRASLERIFNTGNIEVVRRYGANYNPLIPSPFFFGVIKTISDI